MKIVTAENYYEPDEYMSVSAFKAFQKCELSAMVSENYTSEAMLIGSYVDAYIEGTLDEFKDLHPEIFSTRGTTKGELKTPFKYADNICEYIRNDRVFSQFMSGEKQVVMTGKIQNVPFKIKMDSYSAGVAINDLKVMATVTNREGDYIDFITPWGYDIQMACYQEIVRQNTGEQLPVFICAVTKEDPINSVIVNIPQTYLDIALYNVIDKIEHFYEVKMKRQMYTGCGICSACIASRRETQIISLSDIVRR